MRTNDPWVPMFCRYCNVDIDVPRVEWVVSGTLFCEECRHPLIERRWEKVSNWDEDLAMERKYDAADLEYNHD